MKKNLIVKKTLMTTVSQISSGPNKGFYKLTTAAERTDTTGSQLYLDYVAYQNSVAGDSIVHYKYSPGPGKKITGFSKTMLPYVDGYYYISKSYPQVRKLLYALENR